MANPEKRNNQDQEPLVRVVADSISPEGTRLISLEGTMARYVLAELNTHRMFSRNSASSRAVPTPTQIKRILENPYKPAEWTKKPTRHDW